ncbi:hypothetical protein ABZT47_00435 [Sphaerisporangium sp. NPDC005289]|uniref:hypothetical protein n=1 Tax=Sphaerisporangium sp. NPDC005289 TaxID=3155247 RepID=UPI0033A19910
MAAIDRYRGTPRRFKIAFALQVPPTPPGEVRRDVPSALDDLLMRLPAKEPGDHDD